MLGERTANSLNDVLALLYYVDRYGPVTRPQIVEFLAEHRSNRDSTLRKPTVNGVSRQLAVLKKCFGVRFHSSPSVGIELVDWGILNSRRFRRHMKGSNAKAPEEGSTGA